MTRAFALPTNRVARALSLTATLAVVITTAMARPLPTLAATTLASDSFTRNVGTGWGTLTSGQTWYITDGLSGSTSVNGTAGVMTHSVSGEVKGRALEVSAKDVTVTAKFRAEVGADNAPTSVTEFILYTRYEPETQFRYYLRAVLSFVHGSTAPVLRIDRQAIEFTQGIATATLPTTANDPTAAWMLRFQTIGTAVRAKAWPAASSEPASWQIDTTDTQVTHANQFAVGTFTNDVTPAMPIDVDDLSVVGVSAPPPNPPFTDIASSQFKNDITWLWFTGITAGCSQTKYCPDAGVTRGEMAAFLVRALGLPNTSHDYFTDDSTSIFQNDINRLAASGITRGCGPTTYCPKATITREQMAAYLDRALGLPATSTDYFTDDNSSIFENDINRLAKSGITKGCGPTTFCPQLNVSRGQMAAFLHRALTL
jgi:hypothetical protein